MIEKQREGLQEPWIDPVSAAAGGFGGAIPSTISRLAAKAGLKELARPLVAGLSAAIGDYPLGLATQGVEKVAPKAALPFNILAGLGTGSLANKAVEVGSNTMRLRARGVLPPMKNPLANKSGFFGGLGSNMKDVPALQKAALMEIEGATNEKIRKTTGWFRGRDGKYRFEVSDRDGKLRMTSNRYLGDMNGVLDHKLLYENYPDAKNIQTQVKIDPTVPTPRGSFTEGTPDTDQYFGRDPEVFVLAPDEKSARKTILHEIQHFIQTKEGFAKGGNLQTAAMSPLEKQGIKNEIGLLEKKLLEKAKKYNDGTAIITGYNQFTKDGMLKDRAVKKLIDERSELQKKLARAIQTPGLDAFQRYQGLPGEIEARRVASRSDITDAGRKRIAPLDIMQ